MLWISEIIQHFLECFTNYDRGTWTNVRRDMGFLDPTINVRRDMGFLDPTTNVRRESRDMGFLGPTTNVRRDMGFLDPTTNVRHDMGFLDNLRSFSRWKIGCMEKK